MLVVEVPNEAVEVLDHVVPGALALSPLPGEGAVRRRPPLDEAWDRGNHDLARPSGGTLAWESSVEFDVRYPPRQIPRGLDA